MSPYQKSTSDGKVAGGRSKSANGSCPDRQLPLQNDGEPTFVQPTAQGQLLGLIGKRRYRRSVVESGPRFKAQSELQDNLTWRTPHIAPALPAGRPSELASALQYPNTLQKLEIAIVG